MYHKVCEVRYKLVFGGFCDSRRWDVILMDSRLWPLHPVASFLLISQPKVSYFFRQVRNSSIFLFYSLLILRFSFGANRSRGTAPTWHLNVSLRLGLQVVMRQTRLPISLLNEKARNARVHILDTEPFESVFGPKRTRKKPSLKVIVGAPLRLWNSKVLGNTLWRQLLLAFQWMAIFPLKNF